MAENESIGGVSVQIVGNYAPLLRDLEAAQGIAAKAGENIAAGINKGAAAAGEFEQKIKALVESGSTLAQALEKVQTGSKAMASGLGSAGAAAQTAAVQLEMFDKAAMVPYADAAGQLNMFADELEPIANQAKQAAAGVEQFAAAEKHAGDEAVHSASRLDAFKASVAELSTNIQRGAGGLVTIGTMLTAAVTVPLVGVAVAAIKLSSELEGARVAFTTLLGSAQAAQTHLDALKKFAASTPFEFPDLVQASKRLQALGFEAKQIIPTLTAVGNAAAGLSSGAEGINRITTALGQMQTAGKVTAQDMRQLTEAGIDGWKILAKTLNVDVAGAMALVEKRAVDSATAIPALLAGMNAKFGGMMEAQSKTLLGMWSNFQDQLTFTLQDIGDTLAPIAKTILTDGLMPLLEWAKSAAAAFAELPAPIQGAVIGFAGLAAAAGPLLVALGGIGFSITQISTAIPILTTIAGSLASVLGVVLVAAVAAAVLGFADLNAAMVENHRKYDETEKKFLAYIAKLLETAKTADQMAVAEDKIKTALDNGLISKSLATDMLGKLAEAQKKVVGTEWSKYATEMGVAIRVISTESAAAMTTTEAFGVKVKSLRDEVQRAREALDLTTAKYRDHKATAADVAKAYDAWTAATGALEGSQKTLLPVVTNVHKATKEFVDLTKRDFPTAAQAAANATEALNMRLGLVSEQLGNAQRWLDHALERWHKYRDNAGEVAKALEGLEKAQAKVNKSLGELPDAGEAIKAWRKPIDEAVAAFVKLPQAVAAAPPLVRTLSIDLHDLGLSARNAAGEITTKLLAAFEDLATKQRPTLEEAHLAWAKVQQDVNRLAKYDLPEALKVYGEYEALLARLGASQGELLAVRKEYLGLEIRIAEQTGTSATKQIVGLQNVKIAQQLLYDQTHLLGDLYVSVTDDLLKGFDMIGGAVADAIFDQTNLGDAFIATGKKIGKAILEDIVGTYFKALKNAILESTGLLDGLTKSISSFLGVGAKGGAGAAQTAIDNSSGFFGPSSSGAGAVASKGGAGAGSSLGTMGTIGAIAGIGELVSSIIGNFQMAKMEKTLNAIEHNTRYHEIIFQKFAEADEWQRHREILEALGNIFTRLGEVGIGMVEAIGESAEATLERMRRVTGGEGAGSDARRRGTGADTPPPPFQFNGGDKFADGILNSLILGTSARIPGMASGGPVEGDGLRYLHDGEFVVPRAKVPQMEAMSSPSSAAVASVSINSGGANTFHIYESANPRETARQVAEMLKILSPRHAAFAQ
jgi:tape measure domain-containing protein